jgi:energy-coupling factor transporter transmembrane protein EcfT
MNEHSWDSGDGESEFPAYKPISRSAIASLLLGVLSLLVLAVFQLWVVIVLAIACGLYALWTISKDPTQLAGTIPAVVGLMLGLFVFAFLVVHSVATEQIIDQRGRDLTSSWLELITEQKMQQAHVLLLRHSRRPPDGMSMKQFYARNAKATQGFELFNARPIVAMMRHAGAVTRIEFQGKNSRVDTKASVRLTYEYRVYFADGENTDVLVSVLRHHPSDGHRAEWSIGQLKIKGSDDS